MMEISPVAFLRMSLYRREPVLLALMPIAAYSIHILRVLAYKVLLMEHAIWYMHSISNFWVWCKCIHSAPTLSVMSTPGCRFGACLLALPPTPPPACLICFDSQYVPMLFYAVVSVHNYLVSFGLIFPSGPWSCSSAALVTLLNAPHVSSEW